MNWNQSIRQFHRWTSMAFTLAVMVNLVAMFGKQEAVWIGLLALFPLILLLLTGLYLFALPHIGKRRNDASEESSGQELTASRVRS
ncbi:MAG: hypothetical protein JO254_08315 [Pseudolabrys sp.]|nr:hypothetical protein [Pseudolabrys sp.]